MAHRDFAARRGSNKKKKTTNKNVLIGIALAVLIGLGVGLYFLKSKTPKPVSPMVSQPEKTQPKSVLPNRPEEVWSYIKALETRTVPVDDKPSSVEKNMRLTEEQRQVLAQMEKEQKEAEEARKLAEKRKAEEAEKAQQQVVETVKVEIPKQEVKKQPETAKKAESVKVEAAKKAETKTEETKPANTAATTGSKRFGLQCGAFKNRAQAENLQGRLVMAGINAQVMVNGEWNRVRVGPFANRDVAVQTQDKAKSVTACVIIGM
ncbi:cell division protein FtsN [Rodentibacter pneumotropicus]|uniref:Cell division protein FtsN n=1 Tax=Rodentibacter pneumotropicus TaxID=758 RepID=A0A448MKX5_9PAST|nr:cell division protein FtsN [Rodentibacter pneumotropicus]NBH75439.1 cell division protein FtsN [Rodentibacter pneumotropicus]OOF65283.1 cell division protein FtsN [Rodentibacter pneumotropicus]THA00654.1 cell division protein FtsN [Rodentibacter pneumotropicus]THA07048.1 cell division protein FtsN [Rodentibacter pneumotropicus]THA12789.1 cell division protein FtsN [Rodentibacter pneumotropicus]